MKISIIVPIYKGNRYIDNITTMVDNNYKTAIKELSDLSLELILVNDYPDIAIEADSLNKTYDWEISINPNKVNQGIHQSRVNGLSVSTGNYITFLDQDDKIEDNFVLTQLKAIKDCDIVVGNGYRMFGDNAKTIYRNSKKQKLATVEKTYLYAANQIVSPGHCLIKKEAIPEEWLKYIVKDNGGDDLFLWMLMFSKNAKFAMNPECVYTHVDTGENVSLDINVMLKSADNCVELMRECGSIKKKSLNTYARRIRFLKAINGKSKIKKITAYITNLDICFYKLYAYYR